MQNGPRLSFKAQDAVALGSGSGLVVVSFLWVDVCW